MGTPRVLIADDSPLVLRMMEGLVSSAGFEPVTASDGLEAVEKALSQDLDLVILDVTMPRMNGYQTCRVLKSEPATRHIPVIILTSRDQAGDRFWGLETGADYYLTKDADPRHVLELVKNVLAGPGSRRAEERPQPKKAGLDVLSRVNELLDRKLYEATILSEIGRVVRSVGEVNETFTTVMAVVGRVADFSVGALAFVEGDELEVLLALHRRLSPPALDEAKALILEAVTRERGGQRPVSVTTRQFSLAGGGSGPVETSLSGFFACPVLAGGHPRGLLAIGGRAAARLGADGEAFLQQVAQQAWIVTENSRLVERLRDMALRDGLTELYNHRHIRDLLANECERVGRYAGGVSVAMVDIDHFKTVNDRYGHQVGDLVLREVARILRDCVRTVDTVGRYGGEEFLVVLPHTELEDARRLAERLRRSVEGHVFPAPAGELRLTLSVGVASHSSSAAAAAAPDELIDEADRALYRAKEAGRNRIA